MNDDATRDGAEDGNIFPSPFHRIVVVNQLRILEALYPDEAAELEKHRVAIERGYVLHYDWFADWLSNDELSIAGCREVLDILEMHRAMHFSWEKLPEDSRPERGKVKFRGFDGNDESKQFAYTVYFIIDLDRYPELWDGDYAGSLNSHFRMLEKYRAAFTIWRDEFRRSYKMTVEQLIKLIEAIGV